MTETSPVPPISPGTPISPVIGRAAPGDAAAMGDVLSDWLEATPWMPKLHSRDEDAAFCGRLVATTEVWVARAPAVVGFLARDVGEVRALYIAAEARRQGVGRALLAQAQHGRAELSLWTFAANREARAFYARAGFREVGGTAGDNEAGLPDIRLRWNRPGGTREGAP